MDKFIDVSNHQGTINWDSVKASGRIGAICKATEGVSYSDPTFHVNWDSLAARNMVRGAYHFARPDSHTAITEANFFLSVLGPVKPTDILVLDIEVGTGNLSNWALQWLQIVHQKTGIVPWVYSYGSFLSTHLTSPNLAAYPLWLAAYQSIRPPVRAPWTSLQAWQFTSHSLVPGVVGNCDESLLITPLPVVPDPGFKVPVSYYTEVPNVPFTVPRSQGYIVVGGDGGVFAYDSAPFLGSLPGLGVQAKIVSAAWSPSGQGYWLLGDDGGVFGFGDAVFHGGFNGLTPDVKGNRKPVGIIAKGNGYVIVTLDSSNDGSPFDEFPFGI